MKTLIVYFSKYGQTERIARRIGEVIQSVGHDAIAFSATEAKSIQGISGFDQVIIGSPIYVGSHSKEIARFIKRFVQDFDSIHTGFFSVSASASGDDDQRAEATMCMNKFLGKCNFVPKEKVIFAGGIPFLKYNWLIRWIMKRIASRAGGITDTSRNHDLTNWARVDEFAQLFTGGDRVDTSLMSKEPESNKDPIEGQ